MIYKQRIGILFGSASSGTFLIALGADLIVNQQKGMSRGLRVLMDRNTSHIVDIIEHPYAPPMSTRIIIAASLGLSLILAWAQHKYFKDPFSRKTPEYEDEENPMQFEPTQTRLPRDKTRSFFQAQKSRFSHFWIRSIQQQSIHHTHVAYPASVHTHPYHNDDHTGHAYHVCTFEKFYFILKTRLAIS